MPNRIKDFSTLATLPAADDFELLDGATSGTRKISANFRANTRNNLGPRGGISFDGTGGTKCYATLTNQSIGTDPVSMVGFCSVPTSSPATAIGLLTLTSDSTNPGGPGRNFSSYISTGGALVVELYGATGVDFNRATVANFVSSYAGKRVMLAIIRNASGNPGIYINGAAQSPAFTTAGSPAEWQGSITSTYLAVGYVTSGNVFNGCFHSATVYNLALSAADVLELFELGGAVPERFKFGSQTATYASDFSAGLDSWSGGTGGIAAGNVDGISNRDDSLRFTSDNSGAAHYTNRSNLGLLPNRRFRASWDYLIPSTNTTLKKLSLRRHDTGGSLDAADTLYGATDAWTPASFEWTVASDHNGQVRFSFLTSAGGQSYTGTNGDLAYLRNMAVKQIGALLHLPLDDGLGYQLQDVSSNRLHGLISPGGGVSHILPRVRPARVRTVTGSSGASQLCGQAVLPAGYQILAVRARARTGTPNIAVGWSSGAADIVASTGLTTSAWKTLPLTAAGAAPVTGSTDSLWISSNTADAIEWDVTWVPVTP